MCIHAMIAALDGNDLYNRAADILLGKCNMHLSDGFWRSLKDLTYYPAWAFGIEESSVDEMHVIPRIIVSSICALM